MKETHNIYLESGVGGVADSGGGGITKENPGPTMNIKY